MCLSTYRHPEIHGRNPSKLGEILLKNGFKEKKLGCSKDRSGYWLSINERLYYEIDERRTDVDESEIADTLKQIEKEINRKFNALKMATPRFAFNYSRT